MGLSLVSPAIVFPTQEQVAEFEAKYGRIGIVTAQDGESWRVVLRKPTRAEYKMFRSNANNPQRASDAPEHLFTAICVYPSAAELTVLLNEWPGIPEACGKMVIELAGMSGFEQGKY
jgi:hypothetical protein